MIPVRSLLGLSGLPSHRTSATEWLQRNGVSTTLMKGKGGAVECVNLSDLPEPVRVAYATRQIEGAGLPIGTYDETAHAAFATMPPAMRAEAERKAEIARFLMTAGQGLTGRQRLAMVRAKFGEEGTSKASLTRIQKRVKGVDPINYAPALLDGYPLHGAPRTEVSKAAFAYFMTTIRDAGPQFPLKQAWRDVRDLAPQMGWRWPSYETIFRRWKELPAAQKLHARLGHQETVKALGMPSLRDKTSISPLEWVSLDGRTKDFWVRMPDGKVRRLTFLALVDCASNAVLDWGLGESENARSTVRLIKRACQTYGIFDRLYTDNGSAFSGHLVAGGAVHKFRNSASAIALDVVRPLGICHHLGINLHFALPGNGQAKAAERSFATLSRVIDDRPEFAGAHTGHAPGAAPDASVVPVDLELAKAVIAREVLRHNAESGRRGQGARGRSYQEILMSGLATRVRRQPTARQLYLAGLIYTPVSVDRWGRVQVDNWTYGQPDTQEDLIPYHKSGAQVLLGRDPDDFSAPALAWNAENRLICEGIKPVKRGAYGSVDGVRDAQRNRKSAREASNRAAEANNYVAEAEFKAAMAAIPMPEPDLPTDAPLVAGRFGASLQTRRKPKPASEQVSEIPAEFRRTMDAHLADIEAERKPKLA